MFLAQIVLCGQVVQDSDGAEGCFLVQQPPGFHRKGSSGIGVNPLPGWEIFFRIEGLAQKRCEGAARCLDGLIEGIGCRNAEKPFSSGIKPTNHCLFIGGDDAGPDFMHENLILGQARGEELRHHRHARFAETILAAMNRSLCGASLK